MNRLPDGWRISSLAEVGAEVQTGFASGANNRSGNGVIHLRPMNVTRTGALDMTDVKFVEDVSDRRVRSGDVLFNNTNSPALVGKTAFVEIPEPLAYSNHMTRLRFPSEVVDPKFMAHQLHHLWMTGFFERICSNHVNQASIAAKKLLAVDVTVPPLDEQQRIVAILEDHLSRLEVAKDGLRSAEIWSEALQRRAIVSLLAVDGVECELSELLEFSIGGLWGEDPGSSDLDVKVLRVTELGRWGVLDPATAALRSISGKQYESRSLHQGDLLLEKSGGGPTTPVGRVGIVTELDEPSVCSNFMQLMRPDRAKVSPRWLHLYLNACHLAGQTNGMQKASTNIRNIKASEYLRMRVKVPELSQQEVLISECEAWLLRGGRLQASVSKSEREAAGLRLSLLQAAFTGQLTRGAISV